MCFYINFIRPRLAYKGNPQGISETHLKSFFKFFVTLHRRIMEACIGSEVPVLTPSTETLGIRFFILQNLNRESFLDNTIGNEFKGLPRLSRLGQYLIATLRVYFP